VEEKEPKEEAVFFQFTDSRLLLELQFFPDADVRPSGSQLGCESNAFKGYERFLESVISLTNRWTHGSFMPLPRTGAAYQQQKDAL